MRKENGIFKLLKKAVPEIADYICMVFRKAGIEKDKIKVENALMKLFIKYNGDKNEKDI